MTPKDTHTSGCHSHGGLNGHALRREGLQTKRRSTTPPTMSTVIKHGPHTSTVQHRTAHFANTRSGWDAGSLPPRTVKARTAQSLPPASVRVELRARAGISRLDDTMTTTKMLGLRQLRHGQRRYEKLRRQHAGDRCSDGKRHKPPRVDAN